MIETYETFSYDKESIQEAIKTGGKITLRGVIQRVDTVNQNGRIYPLQLLEREIRNYQKFINENRATGELDHPEESVVSLKNVSHIVREVKLQGRDVYGVIDLLNTPSGKIAQDLVRDGVTLGISSRGVGSTVKQGDTQIVQDDFQLICWDLVSEPSTPGAFLREGKRFVGKALMSHFTRGDRIFRAANDIAFTSLSTK